MRLLVELLSYTLNMGGVRSIETSIIQEVRNVENKLMLTVTTHEAVSSENWDA
jgi:hypothetical protein